MSLARLLKHRDELLAARAQGTHSYVLSQEYHVRPSTMRKALDFLEHPALTPAQAEELLAVVRAQGLGEAKRQLGYTSRQVMRAIQKYDSALHATLFDPKTLYDSLFRRYVPLRKDA